MLLFLEEWWPCPALTISSAALFIPRPFLFIPQPDKIFLNKLAPNIPNYILRIPPFFTSFWTISVTPFNNKPELSRDLTILIVSFIPLFDIISVTDEGLLLLLLLSSSSYPDPNIF